MGQLHVEVAGADEAQQRDVSRPLGTRRRGGREVQGKYKKQTAAASTATRGSGSSCCSAAGGFGSWTTSSAGHPSQLHPVRGEGRPRLHEAGHHGRLPGWTSRSRSTTAPPRRGLSDMAFRSPRPWLQKGFMEAQSTAGAHHERGVTAPADHAGDVIGDRNGRRGRIVGMEPDGEIVAVRAQVPMAEMPPTTTPALHDGRARGLLHGALPLRGGAGPHRREGGGRGQGREGKGSLTLPS